LCICACVLFVFFFSSRRRHTRFSRDWSSDVCSSDLMALLETAKGVQAAPEIAALDNVTALMWGAEDLVASIGGTSSRRENGEYRSEERRVGKEGRARWSRED